MCLAYTETVCVDILVDLATLKACVIIVLSAPTTTVGAGLKSVMTLCKEHCTCHQQVACFLFADLPMIPTRDKMEIAHYKTTRSRAQGHAPVSAWRSMSAAGTVAE